VKEQKEQRDVDAFRCEPVGVASRHAVGGHAPRACAGRSGAG
jgi:hypothetical protein